MTAKWGCYIKSIGEGSASANTFLKQINNFINHLISTTKTNFSNPQLIQLLVEETNKALENSVYGQCPKCKKGNVMD